MNRGVGLVAIDMKRAATAEIEQRKRMDMRVVTAAYDRPLAVLRHDERQRREIDFPWMNGNAVFRAHVLKHSPEPVIDNSGDQVRHDSKLGTAKRRRYRVAAERYGVGRRDMLFIAGRQAIGDEGDIDIGLSDEESLHSISVMANG